MTASIIYDSVLQGTGNAFMGRIRGSDGNYVTQAAITSIACTVTDLQTSVQYTAHTPVVATVVFNALQTDARWTRDTTGYNFLDVMPAAAFPNGNTQVEVVYTFTPVSGPVFKAVYRPTVVKTTA